MDGREQLRILGQIGDVPSLAGKIREMNRFPLRAKGIDILQINLGKLCNLSCRHCHVNAGPQRTEIMSRPVLEKCLEILALRPDFDDRYHRRFTGNESASGMVHWRGGPVEPALDCPFQSDVASEELLYVISWMSLRKTRSRS